MSSRSSTRDAIVFPAVPESVATARRWVTDWLADHVELPRVADAVLILSELVTNVVRHGSGDLVCHASMVDGSRCCLAVIDVSPERPHLVSRRAGTVGGIGLHMIDRLAVEWGVADFPGGKTVWAVVPVVPVVTGDPDPT